MKTKILSALAFLLIGASFVVDAVEASIFASASYSADVVFQDGLGGTTMTLAYDGTNYWSSSGGSTDGLRYAEYTSGGSLVTTFAPGLDFRSVFTNGAGNVFARKFASSIIYQQTAPGSFAPFQTLTAGSLDDQSSVVLNGAGTEYVAMTGGVVSRWDLAGNFLGTTTLTGFGPSSYPFDRGIAAVGNVYLTYDATRTLSAWDLSGNLVGTTVLTGAGISFDSGFSLSYANGRVFIVDAAGGNWRGYNVGLSPSVDPGTVPEPASLAIWGLGVAGCAIGAWRRKRTA